MSQPAARVSDMIIQTKPHCHAPIHPPAPTPTPVAHQPLPLPITSGSPSVLVGGLPAARRGDRIADCHLPGCVDDAGPGFISAGSSTVLINGLPAARVNDATMHSGCVKVIPGGPGKVMAPGCTTVLIGD